MTWETRRMIWETRRMGDPKDDLGDPKDDLGDPKDDLGDPKDDLGDPKDDLGLFCRVSRHRAATRPQATGQEPSPGLPTSRMVASTRGKRHGENRERRASGAVPLDKWREELGIRAAHNRTHDESFRALHELVSNARVTAGSVLSHPEYGLGPTPQRGSQCVYSPAALR